MSDTCKTMLVTLQENGIIRSQGGVIIGRIEIGEDIKFKTLKVKTEAGDETGGEEE